MISSEKKMGRSTSSAASRMAESTPPFSMKPGRPCRSCNVWRTCSTITSVASTIIPKSRAPRLSRFAGIPEKCMQMNANSRDNGMVMAVSSAARDAAEEQEQHEHHDQRVPPAACATRYAAYCLRDPYGRR